MVSGVSIFRFLYSPRERARNDRGDVGGHVLPPRLNECPNFPRTRRRKNSTAAINERRPNTALVNPAKPAVISTHGFQEGVRSSALLLSHFGPGSLLTIDHSRGATGNKLKMTLGLPVYAWPLFHRHLPARGSAGMLPRPVRINRIEGEPS